MRTGQLPKAGSKFRTARCLLTTVVWLLFCSTLQGQTLDAELQRMSIPELVSAARQYGDATRGAIVFFQPQMACAKCHVVGNDTNPLGPDLTQLGNSLTQPENSVTDEALIESVLSPSKVIRKGYESVSVLTADGQVISASLVEQTPKQVTLRDVARDGALVTIAAEDIEEIKQNELSIMPAGQMNQLNSKQQFFDLIRYLIEIRDRGAERARQLQPSAALLTFTVPEYESHLDHAGLIGSWNTESFTRGEAIYNRVCANCHGTHEQPGSLPTSLRFAEGKFKNGSDPLSMYRTMTHGFGQMTPQAWMVPSQKYDVIHYIREAYLEPHNSSALTNVDAAYLARLPKGDTFGPEPSTIEAWSAMDYGPSLTHTYEVPGSKHNFAYKGVAVRLDSGAGGVSRGRHWMVFDTDTLRVAAGWNAEVAQSFALRTDQSDAAKAEQTSTLRHNPAAPAEVSEPRQTSRKTDPQENFIDWRAIQFNGEHGVHPQIVGQLAFANSTGPGWANPANGNFVDDQRVLGRDGKQYGPLPREWGIFQGLYHYDQQTIFSYSIGNTDILESPRLQVRDGATPLLLRTFNIGPRDRDLILQVAKHPESDPQLVPLIQDDPSAVRVAQLKTADDGSNNRPLQMEGETYLEIADEDARPIIAGFAPRELDAQWLLEDGNLRLKIPAGEESLRFSVWLPSSSSGSEFETSQQANSIAKGLPEIADADADLRLLTKGGPPRWPQTITTPVVVGADDGPFAVDILTAPESNPWLALTRFTGHDFYPDGRIAICTWDGDVWLVTPTHEANTPSLQWQRIASGMFQPLGLKIVRDKIHLICRDQLVVLHDLNADGETDFYQCLNNDHQVTEHFHEFAMGLQTDAEGNFYYAKSGCHGKAAVVPHHGTLLRVSADGSRTDILANGFRAANGVCLNPDGSFVVTDQEGYWNPKNRINWVTVSDLAKPNFYGNMLGYHDVTSSSDSEMVPPLCWITNDFDRSPAELLWVESGRWGPLQGALLNLSYGYGKVFLVPHEKVNGAVQGGMIELPIPSFPTGVMRGRFHPIDGQLYLCGMFAWAGNATHPGGFYRVRYTAQPLGLATHLRAFEWGLELEFSETVDPTSVADINNVSIEVWDLKRTKNYGSEHFNQRSWSVKSAELSSDGKTVRLNIPEIAPTWGMQILYQLKTADGKPLQGKIHNTIHQLRTALDENDPQ